MIESQIIINTFSLLTQKNRPIQIRHWLEMNQLATNQKRSRTQQEDCRQSKRV